MLKEKVFTQAESDSNVYATVAGENCTLISYTDGMCSVSPYSKKYKPVNDVPIIPAATEYRAHDDSE